MTVSGAATSTTGDTHVADSDDFDIDEIRWAITSALARAANVADPVSAVKDVGHAVSGIPSSANENNYRAALYALCEWLVEDMFPQMEPWDGILPGQDAIDLGLFDDAGSFEIRAPTMRYWLEGKLVSMVTEDVTYNSEPTLVNRRDYLIVTVDAAGTGTYSVVEGTVEDTLPTLTSTQHPVVSYDVGNGPGGATPANILLAIHQPAQKRPERLQTLTLSLADFQWFETYAASGGYVDVDIDAGTLALRTITAVQGSVSAPISLPAGATITDARLTGLKNTPAATDEGLIFSIRRRPIATNTPATLATTNNSGTALSATPFVLALSAISEEVDDANLYEVYIQADADNDDDADNPYFWAVEVDYTMPEA